MTLPACHVMYAILRYLDTATTTHIKPATYNHMATSTAIVEKFPSITTHPVATEHAVPSTLPQGHLPLVIGKNQLLTTTILLLGMYGIYTQSSDIHYHTLHGREPMGSALYIFVKDGSVMSALSSALSTKDHACLFTVN